jgi:fatty acid-binding protein DegV
MEHNSCAGLIVDRTAELTQVRNNQLRVVENGSMCWAGGIVVDTGGKLTLNGNSSAGPTEVLDNFGPGIGLNHHALATLAAGGRVSGNSGPGLTAINGSMVVGPPAGQGSFEVSGNPTDLSCDSTSIITNAAQISGVSQVACANLRPGDTE